MEPTRIETLLIVQRDYEIYEFLVGRNFDSLKLAEAMIQPDEEEGFVIECVFSEN